MFGKAKADIAFVKVSIVLLFLLSLSLRAQEEDPSTTLLLQPSAHELSPEDLNSTRFIIREKPRLDEKPVPLPKTKKVTPSIQTVQPVVAPPGSASAALPISVTPPKPVVTEPEEDKRISSFSMSFAPAFFYKGSDSSYSFRRYTSNGPAFGLGLGYWLTPHVGLQAHYFSSVTASVNANAAQVSSLDVQALDAGLRFRKIFGQSATSPQLSWGFDFHQTSDRLSADAQTKVGHRSTGIGIALEISIPGNRNYTNTFDIRIQPGLRHTEINTAAKTTSGDKNKSNSIGASTGGEYSLDYQNTAFWKLHYSYERNLFSGSAAKIDPRTGITPQGVSVSDNLLIFYFGFKWGS